MAHEPSGVVLNLQRPVQLVAADALLAGAQQVDRLKPLVQRRVAVLENRSDAHRELLAAVPALLEAVANNAFRVLLAGLRVHALQRIDAIQAAAVRTDRTIGPKNGLQL